MCEVCLDNVASGMNRRKWDNKSDGVGLVWWHRWRELTHCGSTALEMV